MYKGFSMAMLNNQMVPISGINMEYQWYIIGILVDIVWGFPYIGGNNYGWLIMENPIYIGYPHFWKPQNIETLGFTLW